MPIPVRFNVRFQGKLPQAERILVRNVNAELQAQGRHLQEEVRKRTRFFEGREKRGIRYAVTGQGLNKFLFVFGELVQHFIDELGLEPGTFPPWGVGTLVFRFAQRKVLAKQGQQRIRRRARRVSHVHSRRPGGRPRREVVAEVGGPRRLRGRQGPRQARGKRAAENRANRSERSASRERSIRRIAFLVARSIFERGIRAGRPFGRTFDANRAKMIRGVQNAFARAITEINS